MARTRRAMLAEHGGYQGYMILLDRLEYRATGGQNGYSWEADGWYGGDYDRLWVKTEGEGEFGRRPEATEIQALYSRAINPWFNFQGGVRYDARPGNDLAHLAIGVEGLAPYWFEVDAALFLSNRGDLTGRLEMTYDQRITNRLVLQPRAEFELAAQDVPEIGLTAGLSTIEAGLRLRYEIRPEWAPYLGISYERDKAESTALGHPGTDQDRWAALIGIRAWF